MKTQEEAISREFKKQRMSKQTTINKKNKIKKINRKKDAKRGPGKNKKMGTSFLLITIGFMVILGLLACRLIWINVTDGAKYTKAALNQSSSSNITIAAKRGDIVDRNGIKLATTARVYNLILDPKVILSNPEKYREPTVAAIEKCFSIQAVDLNQKIDENPNSSYIVLRKGLAYKDVEEFLTMEDEDSNIKGVWLEDNFKRTYPCGTLACTVLGFEQENGSNYGLEQSYDTELSGSDGKQYTYVDADNVLETVRKDAVDGNTIEITIDYNIQAIVEKYIAETYEETNAKNVAALVMDPNSGEVLAMADAKTFDPNEPRNLSAYFKESELKEMSDEEVTNELSTRWTNYCVTTAFEPGSTFKPFTVATALGLGNTTMRDEFLCLGSIIFYGVDEVHCHIRDGHGTLTTPQAMAQSCNVALMTMADRIGKEEFCKMQTRFGFGSLTGIDLPNEQSCNSLMHKINNMTTIDLATNSFGQNFSVTMIQMGAAFSSLINGGNYYQPYVVKNIYNADGALVKSTGKTLVSTTVSNEVASEVKECMRAVVTEGTGTAAAVTGYKIAGKTGTAEKYDAEVQVTEDDTYLKKEDIYLTSFIGFAPYDNPELVCYVVVDESDKGEDSSYASRLFSKIMTELLPYMSIDPDGDKTDVSTWEYFVPEDTEEVYEEDGWTEEEYYEDTNEEYYEDTNEEY